MWGGEEGSQALDQGWLDTFGQEHLSVEEIHRILNQEQEQEVLVIPSQWRQRTFSSSTDSGLGSPTSLSPHGNQSPVQNGTYKPSSQPGPQGPVTEVLDLDDMQRLLELAQELQAAIPPAPFAEQTNPSEQMSTTPWNCGLVEPKLEPTDCDLCGVCREAAGKHSYYGGQVCPSCRAFFR